MSETRKRTSIVIVLSCVWVASGCGYGEVSPAAYDYAMAVYSITNRQDKERLDQITAQIQSSQEGGELSEKEAGWLNDMIQDARDGRWKSASHAARKMMEDQVKSSARGPQIDK